jgi:beta-RFAP synthase
LQTASKVAEHVGLGSGTQLGLAVARAIAELTQQPRRDALTLAQHVGRGLRSALGVHGFERGGLLVEGGKRTPSAISPLLVRESFPSDWHILLIVPRATMGTHGSLEIEAFANLAQQAADDDTTEALCRIVLLGLLPALHERDLQTFGEALYEFNRRVGELFRAAQKGPYAHPRVEELVRAIRAAGVKGVGQSSWGPTVFAVATAEQITALREQLRNMNEEMIVATACNHGAVFV